MGTSPAKLIVKLKGDAKTHQGAREGIYNIGPNSVNYKPHWIHENGETAIWWYKDKSSWRIGRCVGLGKDKCGLLSFQETPAIVEHPQMHPQMHPQILPQMPYNATGWKYFNSNQWIKSDDIMVTVELVGKYFSYVNYLQN